MGNTALGGGELGSPAGSKQNVLSWKAGPGEASLPKAEEGGGPGGAAAAHHHPAPARGLSWSEEPGSPDLRQKQSFKMQSCPGLSCPPRRSPAGSRRRTRGTLAFSSCPTVSTPLKCMSPGPSPQLHSHSRGLAAVALAWTIAVASSPSKRCSVPSHVPLSGQRAFKL